MTKALHKILHKTYIVYFPSSPTPKGHLCCLIMTREGGVPGTGEQRTYERVCQMYTSQQGHPKHRRHPICPIKASRYLYWTVAYRKMQEVEDHFSDNGKASNHTAQVKTMVNHSYTLTKKTVVIENIK